MDLADFDRPLNKRGYREAKEMAKYMKNKGYYPEVILCSSARRTRESLEPILKKLRYKGEVAYLDSIYESSWMDIWREVTGRKEETVMVVGHCPSIETYLSLLLGEEHIMKTCHLAVVDLEERQLVDFIRPKEFKSTGQGK